MRALLLAVIFLCFEAQAQNFAVRLGPAADSTIQNWPVQVQPIGTNTAVANPFLLMTKAQIAECIASNQPAMTAWESNKLWQANAKRDANLARIIALFQQIPGARAQMQTISTNASMNNAQAIVAVKQEANVIDGILEELQRLGPMFKQLYKADEDETP